MSSSPPFAHPPWKVNVCGRVRDVTWEALPSQLPPPQPPLLIEIAEEGREESDDDVEAEVWPLAGRGIQHIHSYSCES